jgi:hypothetical protein
MRDRGKVGFGIAVSSRNLRWIGIAAALCPPNERTSN